MEKSTTTTESLQPPASMSPLPTDAPVSIDPATMEIMVRHFVAAGCDEQKLRAAFAASAGTASTAAQAPVRRSPLASPSKLFPEDVGNLLVSAYALNAAESKDAAERASMASESILRGLSGLGDLMWAAAAYSRDAGEPVDPVAIADVGNLVGRLARLVGDLSALESNCRAHADGTI